MAQAADEVQALAAPAAVPAVSVIVVNHNGLHCLPQMLGSLAGAFQRHSAEIVVIDNASGDGSREWLRACSGIERLELTHNAGFTGGCNAGAAIARGRVLLLMNSDTVVVEALDALVDAALDPAVGAVGCRLQDSAGRLRPSIGLEHTPLRLVLSWLGGAQRVGAPALMRRMETDERSHAVARRGVAWVSGACLATRRAVWQAVGGLDDDYFMYVEDVDYARRVRAAGWRIDYLPSPAVVHLEAGGRLWPGPLALLRTVRGYHLLLGRSRGLPVARATSAALALVFALRSLAFGASRSAPLNGEKASGYAEAAMALWRMALTGRVAPP